MPKHLLLFQFQCSPDQLLKRSRKALHQQLQELHDKVNETFAAVRREEADVEEFRGVLKKYFVLFRGAIKEYRKETWANYPEASKLKQTMEKYGVAKVDSDILGETIYFVLDESCRSKVPGGHTSYTLEELENMIVGGGLTPEGLREVHRAKKEFRGEVVKLDESLRWEG